MAEKRQALGRGLSALIPDTPPPTSDATAPTALDVDLDLLEPNAEQPRRDMDEARLEELAQSLKSSGLIQPIVVRPRSAGRYEIIAGERRWRAAQRAGLLKVPVVVRNVPADQRLELALVENIQRENLNPIDEAKAYARMAEQLRLTQEEIATKVGKDRATVANYQRLLSLPTEVQAEVAARVLTMGHARALVGLPDPALQRRVARDVRARDLSVRETESLVKKLRAPSESRPRERTSDVHTRAAEQELRRALGTQVRVVRARRGGRIEVQFTSEEELQRLYDRLTAR